MTTVEEQIAAVRQSATVIEVIIKLLDDQDIIGVNRFLVAAHKELPDLLPKLNDVIATLQNKKS